MVTRPAICHNFQTHDEIKGSRGLKFFIAVVLIFLACMSITSLPAYADVIVDNGDANTSYTGTWTASSATGSYGTNSLWSRNGTTYSWSFEPDTPGEYQVYMWWSGYTSRTTSAPVTVSHGQGVTSLTVNQQLNPGAWNSLGTYYFDDSGTVTITSATGSTVSTCADAVWFRQISENTPPVAYIDSISPNPAGTGEMITFSGHGTDAEGAVTAIEWSSSIDGIFGSEAVFSGVLSEGAHTITLRVQDDDGLWSEDVTQAIVVGDIPEEVIIDNLDSATSKTGTWTSSSATGYYGTDSVWSRNGTTFTFNFTPPREGEYEVFMWWTEYTSRSSAVPVTITHADGSAAVTVNQQDNGGMWNSLGSYSFDDSGRVTITAVTGSSISTCADAVRFVFVPSNDQPAAYIDNITPNPAEYGETVYFYGTGEDADGTVEAYRWESDVDGLLSSEQDFSISTLTEAVHSISFSVQDNDGLWSDPVTATLTIGDPPNSIPSAVIESIVPNPATVGDSVTFTGSGQDDDGEITGYRWESDIDGYLSSDAAFSTSSLSVGTHTITFIVFDDDGDASDPVTQTLMVEEVSVDTDVIIDNGDSGTSYAGTWTASGATGYYGTNSLWSRNGTTYSWEFTPDRPGVYEVFMWWTEYTSRSSAVPVTITHANGSAAVTVNQKDNGGMWNSLGSYSFNDSGRVTITAVSGSTVSTCADAVRFVWVSDSTTVAPTAAFSSDMTYGAVPAVIQFYDESSGSPTSWLWNFGDGRTSIQQSPSHEYTEAGEYTVTLTATNAYGSDTVRKEYYINVYSAVENIYLCDGYSLNKLFLPRCYNYLAGIGAVDHGSYYTYENTTKGVIYYIYSITDPVSMGAALREEGAHIIFNGHSNYGLGATFGSYTEVRNQEIDDIYYVNDDRFTNYSTRMVSLKVDGMKYGQAYPNWNPVFKDGTSAIMPYDFSEGLPPYNYYLTYTIAGDPVTYRVELADGSYLQRFPDSNTPAWYSPAGAAPDPVLNPEYFITNSETEYNRCDFTGDWPIEKVDSAGYMGSAGYLGYNYQVHEPGTGENKAVFTINVKFGGTYAVLGSWYPSADNATNAKYTINHAYGQDTVEVNQQVTEQMNMLGVYVFNEGAYKFEISDDADGNVIADALILSSIDDPGEIMQAEFSAGNTVSSTVPFTVTFEDLSSTYNSSDYAAEIELWQWDFGDGSTSAEQNPSHTYAASGTYNVTLTVTDSTGAVATETKTGFVVAGSTPGLSAEFTAANRMGAEKTIVNFIAQSKGNVTGWLWDFGDGATSSEQNPMHVYDVPGSYTVSLTVSGAGGSVTESEEDFITNIVGTIYVDNTFHEKPHFYSGSTIKFGKVIVDTGDIKIPSDELRYSRIFYGGCNSSNYYVGTFNKGIMFYSKQDTENILAPEYLRRYLQGYTDDQILDILNSTENAYECYDFTKKPPSMR